MSAGALDQAYGKPLFSSGKWVGFINGNYPGAWHSFWEGKCCTLRIWHVLDNFRKRIVILVLPEPH